MRALKGLTLERSGKLAEALALADEVAKETPIDEQVLYTLSQLWKSSGRHLVSYLPAAAHPRRAASPHNAMLLCPLRTTA